MTKKNYHQFHHLMTDLLATEEIDAEICNDGVDNDVDGLTRINE